MFNEKKRHKNSEKGSDLEVLSKYSVVVTDYHHLDCKDLWSHVAQRSWLKSGPVLNIDIHHLSVINIIEVFMFFIIRSKRKLLTTCEQDLFGF